MTSVHTHAIALARSAATQAHRGQFRKGGVTPYIVHPERVAKRVKFFGGTYVGIIAAWLHDVMEDCKGGESIVRETLKKSDLSSHDQNEIFSIVTALTKNSRIRIKNERQGESLDRITHAPAQAVLVKLCDRMDNLEDGKSRGKEFFAMYLPLTDELIAALEESAIKSGYRNALLTLKAQRNALSDR